MEGSSHDEAAMGMERSGVPVHGGNVPLPQSDEVIEDQHSPVPPEKEDLRCWMRR